MFYSYVETRFAIRCEVSKIRPSGVLISWETVDVRFSNQSYFLSFCCILLTKRSRLMFMRMLDR